MNQPIQVNQANQIKLAITLNGFYTYIQRNRKDWVHINSGDEGSGKFNLTALVLERILDPDELKAFFSKIKHHVHYTIADFGYAVRNSEPYEIQVLDEPVELLARTP